MNWRLSLTLLLLLGAIATGWSVWRMSHPADDGVLRTRPDYVLRDYEIIALDKQGKESFTLRGPRLQRDPADRTMTLATPQFLVPDRLGRYWNVRGAAGLVPRRRRPAASCAARCAPTARPTRRRRPASKPTG